MSRFRSHTTCYRGLPAGSLLVAGLLLGGAAFAQTKHLEVSPAEDSSRGDLAMGSLPAASAARRRPAVKLDRVQVVVRNLGQARNRYQYSLGLSVSEPRTHGPIESLEVSFRDGSALELVAAADGDDALSSFYRGFLEHGEGPSFVALDAGPVEPLARLLGDRGWQTSLLKGDGRELLTIDSGPFGHLVFVHSDTEDDGSGTGTAPSVDHANLANGIGAVWIDSPDFAQEMRLFNALGLEPLAMVTVAALGRTAVILPLARGGIYLLDRRDPQVRPLRGLTLSVDDLARSRQALSLEDKSLNWLHDRRGRSMTMRENQTNGFHLELLDPDPR